MDAYKTVLASKYSARAIAYRLHYGLDDRETPDVRSGDRYDRFESKRRPLLGRPVRTRSCPVRINSIWGIGEHLVDGSASPDVFIVDRIDEKIIEKHVAEKEIAAG